MAAAERREEVSQQTVVVASLATLLALVVAELLLFSPERLSEDVADLVTLCGFGGLAAAGFRHMPQVERLRLELASLALGLVGALAILHAARQPGSGTGLLAWTLQVKTWNVKSSLSPAVSVGIYVAIVAYYIQAVFEVEQPERVSFVTLILQVNITLYFALYVLRGLAGRLSSLIPATDPALRGWVFWGGVAAGSIVYTICITFLGNSARRVFGRGQRAKASEPIVNGGR